MQTEKWISSKWKKHIAVLIYISVNILFIQKYTSRFTNSAYLLSILYGGFIVCIVYDPFSIKKIFRRHTSQKYIRYSLYTLLLFTIISIILLLCNIDKESVRVDRWSAVTYFIDGCLSGTYPYGMHTHVSDTNYPSPFPIWYVVNLPFYIMGDVGIGLVFFILLFVFTVQYFYKSENKTLFLLSLLLLSPAYWWEIYVRSDSVSNVILVFCCIIWYHNRQKSMQTDFFKTAIIFGLLLSTRLTAAQPIALYFFPQYMKLNGIKKIYYFLAFATVLLITFLPFIFWDTESWIFFRRNPFLTQTSVGNGWTLLTMIVLGIILSYQWKKEKNFNSYSFYIGVFIFIFISLSNIMLVFNYGIKDSLFLDSQYDISYYNLSLPYIIFYLSKLATDD